MADTIVKEGSNGVVVLGIVLIALMVGLGIFFFAQPTQSPVPQQVTKFEVKAPDLKAPELPQPSMPEMPAPSAP